MITDSVLANLVEGLQKAIDDKHARSGYTFPSDKINVKFRTKFIAIDIGGSGAYLIEKSTGELFNIKGYGVPDYNKKKKADIGNINTVTDYAKLLEKRWNYLR